MVSENGSVTLPTGISSYLILLYLIFFYFILLFYFIYLRQMLHIPLYFMLYLWVKEDKTVLPVLPG